VRLIDGGGVAREEDEGGGFEVRELGKDGSRGEEVVRLERREREELGEPRLSVEELAEQAAARRRRWIRWGLVVTVLMALGTAGAVVYAVFASAAVREGSGSRSSEMDDLEIDRLPGDPVEERRVAGFTEQARELVEVLVEAETLEQALPWIRDGEALRPRLEREWRPLGDGTELEVRMHARDGERWVGASGVGRDYEPVELTFVPVGGELRLDWEASTGAGERSFAGLRELAVGEEAVMRVILTRSSFHTSEFPESAWRAYQLAGLGADELAWGYVARGSALEEELLELLGDESLLIGRRRELRLMLRLRDLGQAERGQFEIVAVVNEGWIER